MKLCSKCHQEKTEEQFYTDKKGHNGLRSQCKECYQAYRKTPEYLDRNKKRMRQMRHINQDYRANERERKRTVKYREYNAKRVQKFRVAHKNEYREVNRYRMRQWRLENNEEYRKNNKIRVHNRRAKILQNGGHFTHEEWQFICNQYGNICLACGKPEVTIDHVIPTSKGGPNDISNIQPLCLSCNASKGNKTIDYRPYVIYSES